MRVVGHGADRRVTPSLQTPLLICFPTPFFGRPAKECLVHGIVTAPVHTSLRMGVNAPGPQLTDPSTTVVPHYLQAALDWAAVG